MSLKDFPNIEYDIQPGELLCAGFGGAQIRYDERSPEVVNKYFDTDSEPGEEIFEHFTERRGNFHNLEEQGVSTDEDGNPLFSDLVESGIGECLEMSLVGLNYVQDDADEVYLVNGSTPDSDGYLGNLYPEHAYLILEHEGKEHELFDPARLIGGEPVRGQILGVGDFSILELEDEVHEEVESAFGQRYSLQ